MTDTKHKRRPGRRDQNTDSWFALGDEMAERLQAGGELALEIEDRGTPVNPWRVVAAIGLTILAAAIITVIWRLAVG